MIPRYPLTFFKHPRSPLTSLKKIHAPRRSKIPVPGPRFPKIIPGIPDVFSTGSLTQGVLQHLWTLDTDSHTGRTHRFIKLIFQPAKIISFPTKLRKGGHKIYGVPGPDRETGGNFFCKTYESPPPGVRKFGNGPFFGKKQNIVREFGKSNIIVRDS